jgi:membrane protein YdbS with pleckstrin-like domain
VNEIAGPGFPPGEQERAPGPPTVTQDRASASPPPIDIPLPGLTSHLDPRVQLLWSLLVGGPLALVGLVTVGVAASVGAWELAAGLACLAVAAVSVAVVGARLAWSRWTWIAFDDALELRHGVVHVSTSLVPYHRIQQIDVHRGPLQRLLGVSRLVLRTAAATTDATIPGLGEVEADHLRYELLKRAGVDDAV